jgi:putative hydrolase of the HAD superfamily
MYKAVVFDFGNVLCGLDRYSFAKKASAHSCLSPEELDAALWGGALEREFETGAFDSHGYYERVKTLASFDAEYDYERFVEDFKAIILPNPDGEGGLKTAKKLGARTFVLSNTSWLHALMIFSNETLATIPELHILSYKVGHMKPDPEIWKALLCYSGLRAEECLYVDDVDEYCQAAKALGFGVLRYEKDKQNLSQILKSILQ